VAATFDRVTASVADVTARYADWLVRIIVQATAQQASPTVTPATLACALVADPRLGELLRTLYVYPPAYADPSAAYLAQVLATQTARTVDVL
jgi:hypothetical protein